MCSEERSREVLISANQVVDSRQPSQGRRAAEQCWRQDAEEERDPGNLPSFGKVLLRRCCRLCQWISEPAFLDILHGAVKVFGEKSSLQSWRAWSLSVESYGTEHLEFQKWKNENRSLLCNSCCHRGFIRFIPSVELFSTEGTSTRVGLVGRAESSLLEKLSCLPLPLMSFFKEHHSSWCSVFAVA